MAEPVERGDDGAQPGQVGQAKPHQAKWRAQRLIVDWAGEIAPVGIEGEDLRAAVDAYECPRHRHKGQGEREQSAQALAGNDDGDGCAGAGGIRGPAGGAPDRLGGLRLVQAVGLAFVGGGALTGAAMIYSWRWRASWRL